MMTNTIIATVYKQLFLTELVVYFNLHQHLQWDHQVLHQSQGRRHHLHHRPHHPHLAQNRRLHLHHPRQILIHFTLSQNI